MNTRPEQPLFDPERLRVYPRLALVVYALGAIALVAFATAMIDVFGKPLGYDFITFWAASKLTLQGHAVEAFDYQRIFMAEQLAVPANKVVFLWHYPPIYQLLIAPLALLPYVLSYFAFVGTGLALYVVTLRPLFDRGLAMGRDTTFLVLAFPGAFICAFHGQNSLYSTVLFVGGMLLAERGRPWAAGFVLGFLIYKPQLGVLLPVAFLLTGQWRLMFSTGLTALAIGLTATAVFGFELWAAFFRNTELVRGIMENGFLPWSKMPSAFVFFRELGLPQTLAYGAQGLTAVMAAATMAYVWWRQGSTRMSWAVLIAATLLIPPYTFDYEFAILAPVLIILGSDMARRGASFSEKALLVGLYVMPVVVAPIAGATHLQLGFPLLVAALVFAARRALVTEVRAPSLPTPASI
ncbi:MAG: glycosyltransferase family 87 protein [Parvibaculum sp.]|nr:glycosyltransferase family 87 protein [Parvibaculum sp.]